MVADLIAQGANWFEAGEAEFWGDGAKERGEGSRHFGMVTSKGSIQVGV